jgi:hypothetical protein
LAEHVLERLVAGLIQAPSERTAFRALTICHISGQAMVPTDAVPAIIPNTGIINLR